MHLAHSSLAFITLFTRPYIAVHVCCPYLIRRFLVPCAGVTGMPRRTFARDVQESRIRLGRYTQNSKVRFAAEIFLLAGKSMHTKSPCSLSGKVWQCLYDINHLAHFYWLCRHIKLCELISGWKLLYGENKHELNTHRDSQNQTLTSGWFA